MNYFGKAGLKSAALVASGAVALDFLGHLYFTSPMELPTYFVAKWLGAFMATLVALHWDVGKALFKNAWGVAASGAVIFTIYAGLYYGVFASLLKLPVLLPPNEIAIFGVTGPANTLIWAVFHFAAYYVAYRLMQTLLRMVMRYD